jgi:hypothetical protein
MTDDLNREDKIKKMNLIMQAHNSFLSEVTLVLVIAVFTLNWVTDAGAKVMFIFCLCFVVILMLGNTIYNRIKIKRIFEN